MESFDSGPVFKELYQRFWYKLYGKGDKKIPYYLLE